MAAKTSPAVVRLGEITSFRHAADVFLGWARDIEYRGKSATAERLRVSFQSAIEFFGETPVSVIGGPAIEAYKEHRVRVHGVRDITVRHDLHALSVFLRKFACRRGLAKTNPIGRRSDGNRGVSIPSDRAAFREHVITPEEESQYFAAAGRMHSVHLKSVKNAQPNAADLARLMLEQGARPEELLSARVSAFDPASKTLRIEGGKTRASRRTLYLTPASLEILTRRAAGSGEWLFPSDRHTGHHLGTLNNTHDRICREAGVPVAVVAAILGHSSLRTIHRYVHPSAEAQREAMQGKKVEGK